MNWFSKKDFLLFHFYFRFSLLLVELKFFRIRMDANKRVIWIWIVFLFIFFFRFFCMQDYLSERNGILSTHWVWCNVISAVTGAWSVTDASPKTVAAVCMLVHSAILLLMLPLFVVNTLFIHSSCFCIIHISLIRSCTWLCAI